MSRRVRLPRTAAALAEALAVVLELPDGSTAEFDLSGRILATDASRTRLFAVRPKSVRVLEPDALPRARGARARAVRKEWQGQPVDSWLAVTTAAAGRALYIGTARRIFYRSNKHGRRAQPYVHDFGSPAPSVYRAGPNWFFVGGAKRITGRGIEH
jgi:hypothetical protein